VSHDGIENRPDSMQGARLDAYELIRMLGEGGMAQVYLARDVRLGREVAVKVLDARLAERGTFRERFQREARLAAALDHPNIVPLFDYGEKNDVFFLVMPFLSGGSLQEQLARTPLSMTDIMRYGTQITDALEYAHERNVIHRDVKPANMLIHADGRLMLGDFGLAKIFDGATRANRVGRPDAGTPEYMAPEQVQGRTDARSDLYGLGVVLYLLATGRLPFYGSTSQAVMDGHLYQTPLLPRQINANVTAAVEDVIMRALAKNPDERFQSAREMGGALVAAMVAGGAEPLPFDPGPPAGNAFSPPAGSFGSRPNGSPSFGRGNSSVSQLPVLESIPLTPSRPRGPQSPLAGGSFSPQGNSAPATFPSQITGSYQPNPFIAPKAPFSTPMSGHSPAQPFSSPISDRGGFTPPHLTPGPRALPQPSLADEETVLLAPHRSMTLWLVIGVLAVVLLGAGGYLAYSLLLH
jgi:serine/threonine protein kinase